jgi:acetyl-CoA/propionyl-CoA carboxylase biotin carboxyl carrier protein
MQSTVVKVNFSGDDTVVAGEVICVIEAMKVEQPVTSSHDGVVAEPEVSVGDPLKSGQLIALVKVATQTFRAVLVKTEFPALSGAACVV